ncbi:hypothetical protein [Streptomyces flavidovirens]|uniref:Uncharacterized protein n=1 Tax=Streptomyces flavidovirens TaxID=67298 RepID=A0ABW6R9W4_9ACTN
MFVLPVLVFEREVVDESELDEPEEPEESDEFDVFDELDELDEEEFEPDAFEFEEFEEFEPFEELVFPELPSLLPPPSPLLSPEVGLERLL